jgi:hypothetical protein
VTAQDVAGGTKRENVLSLRGIESALRDCDESEAVEFVAPRRCVLGKPIFDVDALPYINEILSTE